MTSVAPEVADGTRRSLVGSHACEACRKLKMRCVRSERSTNGVRSSDISGNLSTCDRCQRNGRACITPKPGQPGRKPGAVGPFRRINKALRNLQYELQRTHRVEGDESPISGAHASRLLHQVEDTISSQFDNRGVCTPASGTRPYRTVTLAPEALARNNSLNASPAASTKPAEGYSEVVPKASASSVTSSKYMSNPLALLTEATEEAQAHQEIADRGDNGSQNDRALASTLLRRPGYVSLGLNLSRDTLEEGLASLFAHAGKPHKSSTYFESPSRGIQGRDTGPNLDPVELGLLSTQDVDRLFMIYFQRLHPFHGILDPVLDTPTFVQPRSALLFTWILALASQFDTDHSMLSKRLFTHGQKLSRYVYMRGLRSVHIVQGYYISLISDRPIDQYFQETSRMYKVYAIGMAADLGLHQAYNQHRTKEKEDDDELRDRIARSEERTWLRILTWERAQEATRGRIKPIFQCDLAFVQLDSWWMHPLADAQDRNACANLHLRDLLAFIHDDIRRKLSSEEPRPGLHWVRNHVDSILGPWQACWLPGRGEAANTTDVFLRFVFMYGRLWTLSFALTSPQNAHVDELEARTTMEDCFQAAIACCEEFVESLDCAGEPLFCMNVPVWVMISYAAVLCLKLFRLLHGNREGYDIEVVALVAQVALHLERAGKRPGHHFGASAVFAQQLMLKLRSYASSLEDLATGVITQRQEETSTSAAGYPILDWRGSGPSREAGSPDLQLEETPWSMDPTNVMFDPCFLAPLFPVEETIHYDESFSHLL